MAPAPAPRKRFDLGNPGAKEYFVVGGVALGVALLYFWWKKRQAAPGAAATDTGTTAPSTPTGLNTQALLAWIQDHQSSTTTTTTATSPQPTPKPKPKPRPHPRPKGPPEVED